MPYKIKKVNGKNCYKVIAIKTGKLMAKCTTKKKAQKQVKLLYMIDNKKKGKIKKKK